MIQAPALPAACAGRPPQLQVVAQILQPLCEIAAGDAVARVRALLFRRLRRPWAVAPATSERRRSRSSSSSTWCGGVSLAGCAWSCARTGAADPSRMAGQTSQPHRSAMPSSDRLRFSRVYSPRVPQPNSSASEDTPIVQSKPRYVISSCAARCLRCNDSLDGGPRRDYIR